MLEVKELSVVPNDYKQKDPRMLLYLYPETLNIVAYARSLQKFSFYQTLEVAEDLAKRQGFILLPYGCIHWQRAKNYGSDRKIKIGRKSFFLMKPNELTNGEKRKLEDYIDELKT
ncbi:hypothetical protein MUN88_14260 [Gracilibacillus caseinilyticus]|uniref:Uncharacterized protein n=1 Tax=Gracilibacillus caseinilyticus TaxID=2932256 RepID=A0ABY4ES23_9BACI|nr:hypothetical protein [Gracilibacillus caseinilyticus]UOQ47230.1 hypothetical protein MUN88_14260 [Gracilibacillus caseinilyticus]